MGMLGDIGTFIGDTLTGGAISKTSAARAANREQQKALLAAGKITQDNYDKNIKLIDQYYDKAEATQQPYLQAGQDALAKQEDFINNQYGEKPAGYVDTNGPAPTAYTPGEFKFTVTPEMKQKIALAKNAVETSASAKGLLGSSGALKKIQQDSADIAQQGVNDQFNQFTQTEAQKAAAANQARQNFNSDRTFTYNKYGDDVKQTIDALNRKYNGLGSLTTMGQTAATNVGNLAVGKGQAITGENTSLADTLSGIETGKANSTVAKNNAVAEAKGGAGANLIHMGTDAANVFSSGMSTFGGSGAAAGGSSSGGMNGLAGAGESEGGASALTALGGLLA